MAGGIRYDRSTSVVTATDYYVIAGITGPCKVRVVNFNNVTTQAELTIQLVPLSKVRTSENISLVYREMQRDANLDISWQGDIEIPEGWTIQGRGSSGTQIGDQLVLTVGYENV